MELQRLFPAPGRTTADALLAGLDLGALAPSGRPYVVANMVASVDGRAAVDGRSGPLGGEADKAMFFALRASVDAVLAGTGTLRAEQYSRLVRRPERRAAREARGLRPDPLALVLSRSGDVPEGVPMLDDPEQPRVVYTGEDAEPVRALRRVREEHGVRSLLCEGGPALNAGLLAAGVLDELFLTVAPQLVGGADPLTILSGDAAAPLELVWALEGGGELFLRYAVARAG
jgi:riboflavin biosynthesis pyrimidine reductase